MNSYLHWQHNAWNLAVYIQPRASKDEVVGLYNGKIKIRLTSAAIENKANTALVDFLAKKIGIAKSYIKIISGEHQRTKLVRIEGLTSKTDFSAFGLLY